MSRRLLSLGLRPRLQAQVLQVSSRRGYASGSSRKGPSLLLIAGLFGAGFGTYALLLDRRYKDQTDLAKQKTIAAPSGPTFDHNEVTVIFVLGGPGAGKGTQCANLVRDYGFVHLSAGDLLRAEQDRPGSQYGELIKGYIKDGKIVPMEVTVALLENAMRDHVKADGKGRFLVDGFPRKMDQALKFDKDVCESKFVLYFDCPEKVMLKRLLKRGESSGRADDNLDSIKKRFKTFTETSFPVVEYYREKNKTVEVSCENTPERVYAEVRKNVEKWIN